MINVNEKIRAKVKALPDLPGVYRWKDKNGRVIYVGKAVNLKNRVRSYVREDKNRSPKVAAMISHADDLDITITGSEMEALILEASLIKEIHPKYNISLRDDKTYPYVKITKEKWPRIYVTRYINRHDGAHYYGPYTNVGDMRHALHILEKRYPVRTCRSMKVDRPCLRYHLGLCMAPCAAKCSHEEYMVAVQHICNIFEGKSSDLVRHLTDEMMAASEQMDYEKAAALRDEVKAVQSIQQKQNIISKEGDFDVIGMARDGDHTGVEIFFIRYGRMIGKENFSIPESKSETDAELMNAIIKNFYSDSPETIPKEILVPLEPEDRELMEEWLSGQRKSRVRVFVPERGFKRRLKDMAQVNAAKYLKDKKLQWTYQDAREQGALTRLKEVLHLPVLPERMECFDISHNQGAETTGSMVVFEHGRPARREYRKFKLRTTQGKPDDFKSMAEVMQRRYGNEKDWPEPDLIVLDGGLGQLHAALPIIRGCGCSAPVIGLAKRMEEIYVEDRDDPVVLDHREPALQLLQHIRDEAHRFVITYHRQWTSKRNTESILEHIRGIGPERRKALWRAFRSLDEMKKASVDELSMVKGMNRKAAENVYEFFRMKKDEKQMIIHGTGTPPEREKEDTPAVKRI
jgi:excinuclease ABC subunit C